MTSRTVIGLTLLTIVCTLALSVFPATSGPFQATHGPLAPLHPARVWILIQFLMLVAATSVHGSVFGRAISNLWQDGACPLVLMSPVRQDSAVLRC